KYDERVKMYRGQAYHYAPILRILHGSTEYVDEAQAYQKLEISLDTDKTPRQHQAEAFTAWKQAKYRGVVVLPTGSGKSFLAQMAISHIKRNVLIVVPTIDLLNQWSVQLSEVFNCEVGMLGGGVKEIRDITVSTYDSALLMMEFIGDKFGLLIYDECHHLPGERNRMSAIMSIAPYRMGLTATPERNDDGEQVLYKLLGPLCYRQDIDQMKGDVLAPYIVERIELELDEDEQISYEENREVYKTFLRENDINFSSGDGWAKFMHMVARQHNGKEAFTAYMTQRRIARSGRAKLRTIWSLLQEHSSERIIVFTADNDTAYEIGKTFFLPVLTHHTKMLERKEMLAFFRAGDYPVLVTSKVLNEGVDVPEASVGIIVSGSGSIREHVQRLGRILRKKAGDKQAILYELVSQGTSEYYVSERRREHRAYK
ncbi:MAG: DEAD/DEAH box helicase family protein, partial [Lentisphaeraceae bacterium]|nr:DEAD/DEAH box helicase family protein [Lentisphaeraceae bacterium]